MSLSISEWTVPEAFAYRAAVKVNPEHAAQQIMNAFRAIEAEVRDEFGEKVDEEGWSPPEEWVPGALLNIDPMHLLGFFWIPARRNDKALAFDDFAESIPYGALIEGFWAFITEALKEAPDEAPLVKNRAQRRASGQRGKSASPSLTSTDGPSETLTNSPSESSTTLSNTEMNT